MPSPGKLPPGELLPLIERLLAGHTPRAGFEPGFKLAAVIVPLLFRDGEAQLLFTQRSHLVESHKGQISFPGGGIDPGDDGPVAAALRETHEEVGIRPEDVRILGRLDDRVTHTSGFIITPFVAHVPADAAYITSDIEVARLIEAPLDALLDPANREPDPRTNDWQYVWNGDVIWGATARILNSFLRILVDVDERAF
jgi:8-oxo-dGTP pyrophosphatase MutT (NUDIX family)